MNIVIAVTAMNIMNIITGTPSMYTEKKKELGLRLVSSLYNYSLDACAL